MADSRAACRYALSLLTVAEEGGRLEQVKQDLDLIGNLITTSDEFSRFLKSPVINTMKKRSVLDSILRGLVGDLTLNFVQLLAKKEREPILYAVIKEFNRLRDQRLGILRVVTRTAVPLTKTQEEELVRKLEQATKKKVHMSYVQDPSLLGGFAVQFDDTVWDASVRRQLETLRQTLLTASVK